jgi:hypothetical protein
MVLQKLNGTVSEPGQKSKFPAFGPGIQSDNGVKMELLSESLASGLRNMNIQARGQLWRNQVVIAFEHV